MQDELSDILLDEPKIHTDEEKQEEKEATSQEEEEEEEGKNEILNLNDIIL